jgi:alkanesulfonate monooxygenase SsuD/methylene tetrahydromethanopterin reductase-like flavin-dependent oxidoreductase (luciferase family)
MGSFRGAVVEKVLQRTARMSDGWLPQFPPNDEFRAVAERFWGYVDAAGRDRRDVGMDCGTAVKQGESPDRWIAEAEAFRALGATHLRVTTASGGFTSPQEHLDAALAWKAAVTSD